MAKKEAPLPPDHYQQLLEKYKARIKEEFGPKAAIAPKVTSREYQEFKKEMFPARYTRYEKACNAAERLLRIKPDPKKALKTQKDLDITHLNTTPSGVLSFAILASILTIIVGSLVFFAVFNMPFFVFFFLAAGALMLPALQRIPSFMANSWRMKTSSQMVESIFYLVTYMRHTSNLERAIAFAAAHVDLPLSLDFRKILWDVETQRYSTIKDSAEAYLETWKEWNKEFVESFHLIESSLYEGSEERRLQLLDKSLDVILNGTYENMLRYAHNLKAPITMLHMLGIILPILGLVILPLVVSFMGGGAGSSPFTTAIYIAVLYNISLPAGVYYMGRNILSKRPAGYGAADISEQQGFKHLRQVNISLGKAAVIRINPLYLSVMLLLVLGIIGISPIVIHTLDPAFEIGGESFKLMEYVCPPGNPLCADEERVGPYGMGAALLSLVAVAGLGISVGLWYALRSKNVIKIRQKTKALEDEFSSALFQLGNRLGDGLPAEIAFSKVAQTLQGTTTGDFFTIAERNITRLGMGLEQALFDPKVGAVVSFPSKIIEASMKVLAESIRKGPRIAAQALLSMSQYIKEIHRVEERLQDLMAEVNASIKTQAKFLTPAIAGIVIGITSMVSTILTRLSAQLEQFAAAGTESGGFSNMLDIFGLGLPTFHFQLIVGIYVVQITYILSVLSNGIENGADKVGERFELGRALTRSTLLYCFLAGVVMVLFNLFAGSIIGNTLR